MGIYDCLYDWQKNIVDYYKNKTAFGIFLDMGLGKTPISLALAESNNCTKVIIISINSKAIESKDIDGSFLWWAGKCKFNYNLYNKKYTFDNSGSKFSAKISPTTNDVLLINYESLFKRNSNKKMELRENVIDFIRSCDGCNVAILVDESHKLKDLNSIQTMAVKQIQKYLQGISQTTYTYLMTGTPFTKGFIDLYSQLKILGCSLTKTQFIDNFCIRGNYPSLSSWQQPIVGYKNVDLIYELIHRYAITIKSDKVVNLPSQTFINHKLSQSDQMKLYIKEKAYAKDINFELKARGSNIRFENPKLGGKINNPFFRNIAYPNLEWIADTTAAFWMRCRQLSIGFQGNEEKAIWFNKNRLIELERLLSQNEDNYVLFYNFTPEFVELYELCEKLGYKIDVYNGLIKSTHYYNEYEHLTPEDKLVNTKRIILANFASGSTGMNWQEYNKCILFSIPLFKDYQQGIKRVHRIGQKSKVIYHIFYEDNWLDKGMLKALSEQKEYDKNMFETDFNNATKFM